MRELKFTGENCFEVFAFVGDVEALSCFEIHNTDRPVIETPHGQVTCEPGDIIRMEGGGYVVEPPHRGGE